MRGGELVPLRRLAVIAGNAESLRVELAEQRHSSGVVPLGALGRLGERGQIVATLESAIGEVGIAGVGIRRGRGRRRRSLRLRQRRCGQKTQNGNEKGAHVHAALSGNRNCSATRLMRLGASRQSQSPSATKSAPAVTSGAISSIEAA